MNNNTQVASGGIGLWSLLAIVFITLKLTGHIAWSWIWVLAPLWITWGLVLLILVPIVLTIIYAKVYELWKESQ